ncbi:putative transferase CAF17 homolog, mitochondrial isoform X1 [Pristis pectinata]|uniref:putative transferase CAF17 homolog, mitochondrial isoform X1 n=1 Tax=Pristis pectinata TaxID=685728 RepID=UPI00223C976D|nr:putative transferase CAF17 homolog, mitochondrial isoform X1 [Pristis pectinata]
MLPFCFHAGCSRTLGVLLRVQAATRQLPCAGTSHRGAGSEAGGEAGGGHRCYRLTHRQLLRLRGRDTGAFLQGLVTNDVEDVVSRSREALYCHLLNLQGRTMFDVILYRLHASQEEPTMLIECDATLLDDIQKHLKIYKIRRKVDISLCPDLFVWAVLPSEQSIDASSDLEASGKKVLVCTRDPRTDAMGWRLVLSKIDSPLDVIPESRLGDIQDYHRHRYKIGIAEGVKDLPSGEAIPLESNLVYMNGISFTKGCYIGQELTARTHYTGVIRKRLMPIQLDNSLPPGNVPEKAQIITESGKLAGRFRNYEGDVGLALIRLAYANEPLHVLTTGDVRVWLRASMPNWWPKDEKNK